MRRALVLVVLVVACVSLLAACAPPPKTVAITSSGCAGGKIFCYSPSTLSVAPGTKVTWQNNTSVVHTVSRCTVAVCGVSGGTGTDMGFGSATLLNPGKTYTFTFTGAGTYVYYCMIHGYATMHGTITVT
jgi:plastocyanin